MIENPRYRLTTIERLAPSLEEIHFQLSNTGLEEHKDIESLAYTISIEKLSFQSIKPLDANLEGQKYLNLQQKLTEVSDDGKMKRTQLIEGKGKQNSNKIERRPKIFKKNRQMLQVTKAILYFDDPKLKTTNLESTSSSLKNSPFKKCCLNEIPLISKNRTRKSLSYKAQPSNNSKQKQQSDKYLPYIEKFKAKRVTPTPEMSKCGPQSRKKILSTRK